MKLRAFGCLPNSFFEQNSFTTPTQLFWEDMARAFLKQADHFEVLSSTASDYQRFSALFNAAMASPEHSFSQKLAFFLQNRFGLSMPSDQDEIEALWRSLSSQLIVEPINGEALCASLQDAPMCLCDPDLAFSKLPKGAEPVLNANALLPLQGDCWSEVCKQLTAVLDAFCKLGCRTVFYEILEEHCLPFPSVYEVDRQLSTKRMDAGGVAVLAAQLFRFLCIECQRRELTLFLRVSSSSKLVKRLLSHAQKTVGLPSLLCAAADLQVRNELILWSANAVDFSVHFALCTGDHPTDDELQSAYQTLIARYPSDTLILLFTSDLRFAEFEKARFERVCINI